MFEPESEDLKNYQNIKFIVNINELDFINSLNSTNSG